MLGKSSEAPGGLALIEPTSGHQRQSLSSYRLYVSYALEPTKRKKSVGCESE